MGPSFRYSKKVLTFYKHEKDKDEMKTLTPQLFLSMKQYTKEQFTKDVISGIIVAIIALPLSIALALASGVTPEQGLYTAIIAGFVISFLGGSKVQIAGPTAAFATIVAGIVMKNGMEGLATATILAGLILVIMGFLRLGSLIRFIPYTITTGFTTGIAVTIFTEYSFYFRRGKAFPFHGMRQHGELSRIPHLQIPADSVEVGTQPDTADAANFPNMLHMLHHVGYAA